MGFYFFRVSLRLKVSRFLWIFSIFFLLRKHQKGQCGSAAVITVFPGFDSQALDLSGWSFFPGFPASSHSPETCSLGSMVREQLGMSMMKQPLAPGVTPPPPQHPVTLSAREVMIEIKASKRCFFFFFFFCLWEKIPDRTSHEIFPDLLLEKRQVCPDEKVEGR